MNEPPRDYIEHDPDEPPRDMTGRRVYWTGLAVMLIVAGGYFLTRAPDWHSLAVGFACGGVFTVIMTAYTGDKVPKWMRR